MGVNEIPPQFTPVRPPPSRARIAVLLTGPLLWVGALAVVAAIVGQLEHAGVVTLITAVSVMAAIPVLLLGRARSLRAEEKARHPDG
jgi:multidrug efflux pump subunit AcrB